MGDLTKRAEEWVAANTIGSKIISELLTDRDMWRREAERLKKGVENVCKHQQTVSPTVYRLSTTWLLANTILGQTLIDDAANDEAEKGGG